MPFCLISRQYFKYKGGGRFFLRHSVEYRQTGGDADGDNIVGIGWGREQW